jgi:hypothetical protein
MKMLGETLAILLLIFLLAGDPDAWDVLHAKVMGVVVNCPQQEAKPVEKKGPFDF